jgi:hypothetical protein
MTIDNAAYDMIENIQLDINQYNDFLRMMDDYKSQLYMKLINREENIQNISDEDFNDLPF